MLSVDRYIIHCFSGFRVQGSGRDDAEYRLVLAGDEATQIPSDLIKDRRKDISAVVGDDEGTARRLIEGVGEVATVPVQTLQLGT